MYRISCLPSCKSNIVKVAAPWERLSRAALHKYLHTYNLLAMTGLHDSDTAVLSEPCSRPQEMGFIIDMDCVLCELQAEA